MYKQTNAISCSSSEQDFNQITKSPDVKKEYNQYLEIIPNPSNYKKELDDGIIFQKYSSKYIKNILFKNLIFSYFENVDFDFNDYTKLFIQSFSQDQCNLFCEIIGLRYPKESEQYASGDFDLIFNGIKGKDINTVMESYPSNVFQSNKIQLQNEETYSIIFEIKKNYFTQLRKADIKKQLTKYNKILHLLSLRPELKDIKNRLKITNKKLIFSLVTNGEYKKFFSRKFFFLNKKNLKMILFLILKIKKEKLILKK